MPELPDITLYIEAMAPRLLDRELVKLRIASPFLLRSVEPPPAAFEGRRVTGLRRLGKRIAIGFEADHWMVLHLMIAGRLHWRPPASALPAKRGLAAFDFADGSLTLTEAGSKRRASLVLVEGAAALQDLDPGGLEVLAATPAAFEDRLTRTNHSLKRALTDPRILSGIGNAYSDEILHRAGLSPVAMTGQLSAAEIARLYDAIRSTLEDWIQRLRAETGDGFPEKVTAFRTGMAVHGRYGKACPLCGTTIQRIRHSANETNYCPTCQTGGKILADRSLSRLLKKDWPKTVEELEKLRPGRG